VISLSVEERLSMLEDKINALLDYRKDIGAIRKLIKFIKKNRKYFRFGVDVLLFISTILGFFII